MEIAICDDDLFFCHKLEQAILEAFGNYKNRMNCEVFTSGDELLENIKENKNRYHIYFLDIEMTGTDGIETARKIREQDLESLIIFVTSFEEYMPKSFDVVAFNYLVKPVNEERLFSVLLSAENYLLKRKKIFQFFIKNKPYVLLVSQINYFESSLRKVLIHTTGEEVYEYYDKLKNVEEKLDTFLFARIHASYLVNMDNIQSVEKNKILLRNGEHLPVSQKYHKVFLEQFRKYLLLRRTIN